MWLRTEKRGTMHSKYLISASQHHWWDLLLLVLGQEGQGQPQGCMPLVARWWWYLAFEGDRGGWAGESCLQPELEARWPQAPHDAWPRGQPGLPCASGRAWCFPNTQQGDLKSLHFFPSMYLGGKPPREVELLLGWCRTGAGSWELSLQWSAVLKPNSFCSDKIP